jgi:hypothetical protein
MYKKLSNNSGDQMLTPRTGIGMSNVPPPAGVHKGGAHRIVQLAVTMSRRGSKQEQLQPFGKSTWHPYNFGKTRKIGLQQFDKPTWQK